MNEKELIVNFIEKLDNEKWRGIIPNYDAIDEWVDEYLKEIHKEYYEVEFVKKAELFMDSGEGKPTVHTMQDGTRMGFYNCWEDNEGYIHHTDNCAPYDCERNK